MSRDFNGSSHYLELSSLPVSSFPYTLACWANCDSATAQGFVFGFGSTTAANTYTYLSFQGTVFGDPIRLAHVVAGSVLNSETTTGYSTGTWHHVCGVLASNTSRAVYLDGGSKGTNTGTSSFSGSLDRTSVGRLSRASPAAYFDGRACEAAIWDVALTDAEVAILAKGASPLIVRPQSLVGYWPIIGEASPEIDIISANALTVSGATKAAHPRVFYLPNDRVFPYIVTSGGAYSLTCDPGSFAVTGTAASLLHDKSLDAATDSYVWTGTAAGLQYGSTISAEEGNYVWTGTAASVLHDKILVADTDSYAWTGSDATLTKAAASTYTLDCEGGIYAVNGTAVSFGRTYALSVDSGVYAWTGTDATLNYSAVPTEPYSIGYTGGGRIMKPGEFPEWWKEEEEPQPKVIKKKRSSKEQIAEAAAGLRVKEKHEKVVEFPKKPAGTSTPEVKEVEKEIKEDFKEKTESVNDEIKALREDIKNTSEKIKRTEKRILAALMLLSRQLRK